MTTTSKSTKNNLQGKDLIEQNLKTLNQLALKPNITIKRKEIIKNSDGLQIKYLHRLTNSKNKTTNPQSKTTNSQNKVASTQSRTTNSQNKTTNSQSKTTNSQNNTTNSQKKTTNSQKKTTNSQNNTTNSQNNTTNSQSKTTDSLNKVKDSQNPTVENKTETKSTNNNVGKIKSEATNKSLLKTNSEYYPERCKRTVPAKKIKLQPKHEYHVVATTNKRKRRTPQRGVNSVQPPLNSVAESPLQESDDSDVEDLPLWALVQLADAEGLDDEDFMEILTCPSPVWWEEASDDDISVHEYFVIETRAALKKAKEEAEKPVNEPKPKIDNKLKTDINFYKKFITKRAKMEVILGRIKEKNKKQDNSDTVANKDGIGDKQNIEAIDNIKNSNNENLNSSPINKEKQPNDFAVRKDVNDSEDQIDVDGNTNDGKESIIDKVFGNRKRKISSGSLSDVNITEDELVVLENIEIPVGTSEKGKAKNRTTNEIVTMEINSKNVGKRKSIRNQKNNNELKSKDKIHNKDIVEDNKEIVIDELTDQIEMDIVSPLTINPLKNTLKAYASPKSSESINSETTIITEISDSNIKFLDENVDNKKEPIEPVSIKKYEQGKDGETVTVYRIVNKPDSMEDVENQIKVNLVNKSPKNTTDANKNIGLNSFYKTRKNAYRSGSKYKKK